MSRGWLAEEARRRRNYCYRPLARKAVSLMTLRGKLNHPHRRSSSLRLFPMVERLLKAED